MPRMRRIKILVLTANDIERQILFYYFSEERKQTIIKIPYEGLVYSFFKINNINVVHVESENTGSFTRRGSADTLKKAIKIVKPSVIISAGVAFGLDYKEYNIGDVLIGRQFFAYDKSAKMKDSGIKFKTVHLYESGKRLLYKAKSTIFSEQTIKGYFNNEFKAEICNMLTGEFVIDSEEFKNDITNPFKFFGIVGGEMEAYGIFKVLEEKTFKREEAIVIKGICDWGAGKNAGKDDSDETSNNNSKFIKIKEEFNKVIPKDAFQAIAMINTCVILEKFLVCEDFYSDFRLIGIKKRLKKLTNWFRRAFIKKYYDINLSNSL